MYFLIKESPVNFPDPQKHGITISAEAKDLIKKLLDKNKKNRFGSKGDVKEILSHDFFKGLDINLLIQKKLEPPYKPQMVSGGEGDFDLRFFDQRLTSKEEIVESMVEDKHIKIIQKNKNMFEHF